MQIEPGSLKEESCRILERTDLMCRFVQALAVAKNGVQVNAQAEDLELAAGHCL
jgi:hypothetical protein